MPSPMVLHGILINYRFIRKKSYEL
jgi:hypothetical protein